MAPAGGLQAGEALEAAPAAVDPIAIPMGQLEPILGPEQEAGDRGGRVWHPDLRQGVYTAPRLTADLGSPVLLSPPLTPVRYLLL